MTLYREQLPQLSDRLFLTDAGIETDLIFNHGIDIPEFAAHTLLPQPDTREAVARYLRGFLALARERGTGFILDSQTWKAHMHWASDLGASEQQLQRTNHQAIEFIAGLRDEFSDNAQPIVLNGVIGPRGDAYAPETAIAAREAEAYHATQVGWLADTRVDMVTGLTFTQADEAIGLVRAARQASLPVAISFTVETDGRLPTGQPLAEAITEVDAATESAAIYFMVNCAHPDHFEDVLQSGSDWLSRIGGVRANASRMSHAELDESEVLDDGNPVELGRDYSRLMKLLPNLRVLGGCCGTDHRHVDAMAQSCAHIHHVAAQ